ncbi:MAG: hypothetical protein M0Z69_11350 [Actinomycetota bacterium]|nr:hypothetical protein [Actinomycetota bacterium]
MAAASSPEPATTKEVAGPVAGRERAVQRLGRVVEVLPDVSGIDRSFHYLVPAELESAVAVGTVVRVRLHGRRVRGWVIAEGSKAALPDGVALQPLADVVSAGPPPEVVALCRFAAWRYAGRLRPFLLAASPERIVRDVPAHPPRAGGSVPLRTAEEDPGRNQLESAVGRALAAGDAVLRLPPTTLRLPVVMATLEWSDRHSPGAGAGLVGPERGSALVLVESREDAVRLVQHVGALGRDASLLPEDWRAVAAGGRVGIGTRNAVLAPSSPSVILVLDAHSEAYRSERVPTFDARVIAAERARRAGVPVLYVSPCPSVELLSGRVLVRLERSAERAGWGRIGVLDTRREDPREGGYPSRLATLVREALAACPARQVVVVLNRKGRARLLCCPSCGEVQRCDACGKAMVQPAKPAKGELGELSCPTCGSVRAAVCPTCGSARLRILRPGVSRAREQLGALLSLPVGEVAGGGPPGAGVPDDPVLIGTEAVLHRVGRASMVVFLDFDQELLVARFRAAEHALVLVARAVRMVAERSAAFPQVVLRTSMPDHEVVEAARRGDPDIVEEAERRRRKLLALPPERAFALVSDDAAVAAGDDGLPGWAAALPSNLSVVRAAGGRFLVSGPDSRLLADGLAGLVAGEPGGWAAVGLRVEVDPLDV